MDPIEATVAREAKVMTREEVVRKAIGGTITWWQAAEIAGVTDRHMSRLRERYERFGIAGLRDGRTGKRQPSRIPEETVEEVCRLKRDVYPDFSIRHFHRFARKRHGIKLSYTWVRMILQMKGIVEKAPARGKYRRKRERRPMVGMMLHLDGSTHEWIPGKPADLMVMLDDADGRILYARFVPEENTMATLEALQHVLVRWGRFCEFYTDRGSHFCRTSKAGEGPDEAQNGQVTRVLKALGIRHILARTPEARGRSERAFGTIQGQLPQELRLEGITDYEAANRYLEQHYIPAFNEEFTVTPAQPESAFVRMTGVNLELLVSIQHERVVAKDNTVHFERLPLQLPTTKERLHFVRCPVTVHEFINGTIGVSFQGRLIERYSRDGQAVPVERESRRRAA